MEVVEDAFNFKKASIAMRYFADAYNLEDVRFGKFKEKKNCQAT